MSEEKRITMDMTVSHRKDLLTTNLADELVMMNLDRGSYYGMEAVATQIWNSLESPLTVAELCEELLISFEIDRETCQREVLTFLHDLQREELIHVYQDPS